MDNREKLKIYVCKSLDGARRLFELFKSMNLDNLDEKEFFHLYKCGKDDVGFMVRFNTWQVGRKQSDELFEVVDTEIFE